METVAEYIFDFLQKKGSKNVFMVSGSSAMWLTDALKRNEKLSVVCNHHEQASAMSADIVGRLTSVPGVALVTIGPGATNAITGVAQSYLDSSPMFIISGQASSKLLKYEIDTGIRQHGTQSLNLEPIVSSITKYFAAITDPADIRYYMERAYFEALNGRCGPVWIDVPVDIQNKKVPNEMRGYTPPMKNNATVAFEDIIDRLAKAQRPLIMAGYGVRSSKSVETFRKFINKYKIPVVTSRGGIDVVSSSDLFVGRPGGYGDRASHFAIQQSDFMLILGSRLSVSTTGYYPQKFGENAYKIMVDIDDKELAKHDVIIDEKHCCELKYFITALYDVAEAKALKTNTVEWVAHCMKMREQYPNMLPKYKEENPLNSYYFTDILSDKLREDEVIVVDTGSVCNIVSQSIRLKEKQRYMISGGLSCMGFWAGAIGAAKEQPHVTAITGDGSAQMNIQELATIEYNNLPLKLFIYNNKGYLLIRHNQHNYMEDRFLGVGPDSGLKTPDFCALAGVYGIKAVKISAGDNLEKKLDEVYSYDGPVVCEVMVQEFGDIAPRIASKVMPDGSLKAADFDDLYPFLDKE